MYLEAIKSSSQSQSLNSAAARKRLHHIKFGAQQKHGQTIFVFDQGIRLVRTLVRHPHYDDLSTFVGSSDLPLRPVEIKPSTESTWSTEVSVGDHPEYQSDSTGAAGNKSDSKDASVGEQSKPMSNTESI